MNRDPKRIPLPRRYALLLGPLVGAATGATGLLFNMNAKDVLAMVILFTIIGLLAGGIVFAYDSFRRKN